MAEFCKKCADKLGLKSDEPCFCENCKKYINNKLLPKIMKKM